MSGCAAPRDRGGELGRGGERGAVLEDEAAQRPAVAEAVERTGHQGEVNVRGRLVPGAERAGGHVLLDRLGRGAQPGVFPVVNRARAVGGQVGQPACGHHPLEDPRGAVAQQVGAVDQHDRGPALAGGPDLLRAVVDDRRELLRARRRSRVGIDQDLVGPRQAAPLGEGKDLQPWPGRAARGSQRVPQRPSR